MTAEEVLNEVNVKPTPNRVLVLRALMGSDGPMSLPELEISLPTLEKSSIFRVLNLFLAKHIVHTIEDGRGIAKYEQCHSSGDDTDDDMHPHFYCEKCQRTFCLHDVEMPQMPLPEGFHSHSVNFMIKGLCPKCSKLSRP